MVLPLSLLAMWLLFLVSEPMPSLSGFPRLSSSGVLQAAAEVRQISCSEVFLFNSNKFVLVFPKQTTPGLSSFIYLNDSRLAFISKVIDEMF